MVFDDILKVMPLHSSMVDRRSTIVTKRAFSLVELLVVIALFGITSVVITVSYLSFEKNERVKNGALALKSDIRLAQSKALSGDKGANVSCTVSQTLAGWYVRAVKTSGTYYVGGVCFDPVEIRFNERTALMLKGITVKDIIYNSVSQNEVNIFFRPLLNDVSFQDSSAYSIPDFVDSANNPGHPLSGSGDLVIELQGSGVVGTYKVKVNQYGEVDESR